MIPKIVHNYIDESSVTRKERLKIPYSSFTKNSRKAVKELLGQDIIVRKIQSNSIITDDECFIVDVEYVSIKFNPFEIIFVNINDIKPVIPNSTTYASKINGCNVCIKIPKLQEYKTMIPITISPKLSNNNCSDGQMPDQFSYFGTIVRKPMHSLCTPLKYPGHQTTPFKIPPITKLYPEGYKLKKEFTLEQTKEAYQAELTQFQQLKAIDNVVIAKSFSDCKYGTTAYVIDFGLIPRNRYLNGIILVQPKRIPGVVLYYPTNTYTLYLEELESIKSFLDMDEINALNYDFTMNQ